MAYERRREIDNPSYNINRNEVPTLKNLYFGTVKSIEDDAQGLRIKVKIPEFDKKIADEDLKDCIPLIPKFFYILPKINEIVLILISDKNKPYSNRYWIGPFISQIHRLNKDNNPYSPYSTTDVPRVAPTEAPKFIPESRGIYPDSEDIALLGRDNSDIQLKKREVIIRAGQHNPDDNLILNRNNPSYIKLRLNNNEDNNNSSVNIVADNINLLSNVTSPYKKILDDDEILKINNKAHPLGKGDFILKYLTLLKDALLTHIHGYSTIPPDRSNKIEELRNTDFTDLLSNNIRIS
ncbi:MAG: hypothetical protein ACOC33_00185 [bacterium]